MDLSPCPLGVLVVLWMPLRLSCTKMPYPAYFLVCVFAWCCDTPSTAAAGDCVPVRFVLDAAKHPISNAGRVLLGLLGGQQGGALQW